MPFQTLWSPWAHRKGVISLTILGYYDGVNIRLLEKLSAKPNQKVLITTTEEFLEPVEQGKSLLGVLSKYADPSLMEQEAGAWERAVVEKYGHS